MGRGWSAPARLGPRLRPKPVLCATGVAPAFWTAAHERCFSPPRLAFVFRLLLSRARSARAAISDASKSESIQSLSLIL